jgi:hypothetical protein
MNHSLSKMVSKNFIKKSPNSEKISHKLSKDKYSQFLKNNNLNISELHVKKSSSHLKKQSKKDDKKDDKNIKKVILTPTFSKKKRVLKKKKTRNILEIEKKITEEKLAMLKKSNKYEKSKQPIKEPIKQQPIKEPIKQQPIKEPIKQQPIKEPIKQKSKQPIKKSKPSVKRSKSLKRKIKKEKSKKLSFYRNKISDKDVQKIHKKIESIKNRDNASIKKELISNGIRVSGKSDTVLKDIYMYTKICDFKINFEK